MIGGVLAGLAVLLGSLVARVALGVPLPVELVSDRFLPFVPVRVFVALLGVVGGPVLAKELAFYSSFLILIGIGVLAARGYARIDRHRLAILAGVALSSWLVALAVLWPALASNYHGLPPDAARALAAGTLAVLFVLLAGVLDLTRRYT
ncbi:MAG: hypothetical protein H0T13_02615 [Actinobacteria bacterium]|nr:hypothetical protein [Actinomycetota bacterium]